MKVTSVIVGGCAKDGDDIIGCMSKAAAEFFAVYLKYSDCDVEHLMDFDTIEEAERDAKDMGEYYNVPVERCRFLMEAAHV